MAFGLPMRPATWEGPFCDSRDPGLANKEAVAGFSGARKCKIVGVRMHGFTVVTLNPKALSPKRYSAQYFAMC